MHKNTDFHGNYSLANNIFTILTLSVGKCVCWCVFFVFALKASLGKSNQLSEGRAVGEPGILKRTG